MKIKIARIIINFTRFRLLVSFKSLPFIIKYILLLYLLTHLFTTFILILTATARNSNFLLIIATILLSETVLWCRGINYYIIEGILFFSIWGIGLENWFLKTLLRWSSGFFIRVYLCIVRLFTKATLTRIFMEVAMVISVSWTRAMLGLIFNHRFHEFLSIWYLNIKRCRLLRD